MRSRRDPGRLASGTAVLSFSVDQSLFSTLIAPSVGLGAKGIENAPDQVGGRNPPPIRVQPQKGGLGRGQRHRHPDGLLPFVVRLRTGNSRVLVHLHSHKWPSSAVFWDSNPLSITRAVYGGRPERFACPGPWTFTPPGCHGLTAHEALAIRSATPAWNGVYAFTDGPGSRCAVSP